MNLFRQCRVMSGDTFNVVACLQASWRWSSQSNRVLQNCLWECIRNLARFDCMSVNNAMDPPEVEPMHCAVLRV